MTKPAITPADLEERRQRRDEWRSFRKKFLYSQRSLAAELKISIRYLQYVEAAAATPTLNHQKLFRDLNARCEAAARKQAE